MTLSEVADEITAYNRREKRQAETEQRLRAVMDYRLASLIRISIGDAFGKSSNFPRTVVDAYPDIFREEKKQQPWQESKEHFARYAEVVNQKFKQKEG